MQYKTIVLEMLKDRRELHEQLRLTRRLLPTMETCAKVLKVSHEYWKQNLADLNPGSDSSQISSEAMELAMKELEDRLPAASGQHAEELPTLEQITAFLIPPSPPE